MQHRGEGGIARPLTACKRDRDVIPRQVKESGDEGWPNNDGQIRVESLAQSPAIAIMISRVSKRGTAI